jgi:3-oxoadipate enol-lactonase
MPKVKVGDINIYYEIHGKGEPLVIIHGTGGSVDSYSTHISVFSQLYRVIIFDPRGTGQSDAPDIPYTIDIMADDLAGLLDAIGIDSLHILGESMGGMIAQQFTLRHPERVRSLILAGTTCGGSHSIISNDPELMEFYQHAGQPAPKEFFIQMARLTFSRDFIEKNPDLIKQTIEKLLEHPASPQGQMRLMQAVMSYDMYEKLPEIKAPTLVIHGDADRIVPVENARILASRIPNAELVILKKMGHLFMFEAFDESNRIILDFLKRHSTKKA